MAAVLAVLTCSAAAATREDIELQQQWVQHIWLEGAGQDGQRVLDLDGDGRGELVLPFDISITLAPERSAGVVVVGFGDDGDWRVLDSLQRPDSNWSSLVLRPPLTQADTLVLFTRGNDEETVDKVTFFSGLPLREIREVSLSAPVGALLEVGDFDGDGMPDALEVASQSIPVPHLALRSLVTGEIRWIAPGFASFARGAQLDGDPALEIIVTSEPGRIIDGATGLQEWSFPTQSAYWNSAQGQFQAGGRGGFAMEYQRTLSFFRGTPYAHAVDHPVGLLGPLSVGDFDGDGIDEVAGLLGDAVELHTAAAGLVRTIDHGLQHPDSLAVGNVDDDPALELVVNNLNNPYSAMNIVDASSGEIEYRLRMLKGHVTPHVIGDFNGNGRPLIVAMSIDYWFHNQPHVAVLDAESGEILRTATLERYYDWDSATPKIIAAQLDDDPQDEIVFTYGDNGGAFAVLDGQSLTPQWSSDSVGLTRMFRQFAAGDVDGDGKAELVALVHGPRGMVLDGTTGEERWSTVTLPGGGSAGLSLIDTDDDGIDEIAISSHLGLYVFDAVDRLLSWSVSLEWPESIGHFFFDRGGECRVATYAAEGQVEEFRCISGTRVARHVFGRSISWLGYSPTFEEGFVATSEGRVRLLRSADGRSVAETPYLTSGLGLRADHVHLVHGDGALSDVIYAGQGSVRRVGMMRTHIFGEGFE